MCLINNCHGKSADTTKQWGLRTGLCVFHYDAIRSAITRNGAVSYVGNEGLLDDFVRLKALMIDKETMIGCMKQLDTELRASAQRFRDDQLPAHDQRFGAKHQTDGSYVRLSRALEYYEGLCWFPAVHVLFIGALTANDFLAYLTRLYMAKDPGAGANHGDFTHRLQWHAIMRVATNNFTTPLRASWRHSPVELYRAMGQPLALSSALGGVWGFTLDNNSGVNFSCPMPRGPNQQVETYGAPALFHLDLLQRNDLPMLRAALSRRFGARSRAEQRATAAIDSFWTDFAHCGLSFNTPKPGVDVIANKIYAWKKGAGPGVRNDDATTLRPLIQKLESLPATARSAKAMANNPDYQSLVEAVAYRLWRAHGLRPGAVGHYTVGPTLIDQLLGPVLTTVGERQLTPAEVDSRVALSRRQFNTSYRFAKGQGVTKVFASG